MLSLYPYKKFFPKLFQKEKLKLQKLLGKKIIIEHVGSTAIPQMSGKGIIDIIIAFDNKKQINNAVEVLSKEGYYLSEDKDRNDRIFMSSAGVKESTLGDIHLHLVPKDSLPYKNLLFFRDYLINHPEARKEYINLKYQIIKEVKQNRVEYTKKKKEFIEKILELTKKA